MDKISLVGLDKAMALAVLYNASKPQGLGFFLYNPKPMGREEAAAHLERGTYFDYLQGRVMKVDLSGDELDPWLYDRYNGQGAAVRAIGVLRQSGDANSPEIAVTHRKGTLESADQVDGMFTEQTTIDESDGVRFVHLGVGDLIDSLGAAVKQARKKLGQNEKV